MTVPMAATLNRSWEDAAARDLCDDMIPVCRVMSRRSVYLPCYLRTFFTLSRHYGYLRATLGEYGQDASSAVIPQLAVFAQPSGLQIER